MLVGCGGRLCDKMRGGAVGNFLARGERRRRRRRKRMI